MTRAIIHIGLAVALVLAPTLCCCKSRWLAAPAQAANVPVIAHCVPSPSPKPVEPELESCCAKKAKTCCLHTEPAQPSQQTGNEPSAPRHAPECACCMERPDAALPEITTGEEHPQQIGEFLSLAVAYGAAGDATHASRVCEAKPPERAGVDARYESLFLRHVLRC
jgi:hypothetical protein